MYNTQYTFDILSSSFWYQPDLGSNWTSRWVAQLARQTTQNNYYTLTNGFNPLQFSNGINPMNKWIGFGTTLNVPTNKTYYVGIIGQGAMQVKLDGTTILCTSPNITGSYPYSYLSAPYGTPGATNLTNFPAYAQNGWARLSNYPNGPINWGVYPPPFYGANPYLSSNLYGVCTVDHISTIPGAECAPYNNVIPQLTPKLSGYNLYIYPVTMSAGCHKINFENIIA